jgi:uncharacterized protein (DUF2345 family)
LRDNQITASCENVALDCGGSVVNLCDSSILINDNGRVDIHSARTRSRIGQREDGALTTGGRNAYARVDGNGSRILDFIEFG